jgi:hypothetical protein
MSHEVDAERGRGERGRRFSGGWFDRLRALLAGRIAHAVSEFGGFLSVGIEEEGERGIADGARLQRWCGVICSGCELLSSICRLPHFQLLAGSWVRFYNNRIRNVAKINELIQGFTLNIFIKCLHK